MLRFCRWALLMICLGLAVPSLAASLANAEQKTGSRHISDQHVRELLGLALRFISSARCKNDLPCEPATESELKKPPVSLEHGLRAIQTGVLSAVSEKCGIDREQKLFLSMMAHFRHSLRLNDRQLAILALMHGIEQGTTLRTFPEDGCTPELKRLISDNLPKP